MSRLDTSIPLNVRPQAPAQDPLEGYGKMMGLKNVMQQGRLNEQAIGMNDQNMKTASLRNQELERARAADEALVKAIQDNTKIGEDGSFGIEHDVVEAQLVRAGFQKQALEYSKQRQEIENASFDHVTKQLDMQAKKAKMIGGMAQSVLNADPLLRPELYSVAIKQAMSSGLVDQKTLQDKGIPTQYEPGKTDAILQQLADLGSENPFEQHLKVMQEKRAASEEARKVEEFDAKLPGEKAEALKKQVETESLLGGGTTDQATWDSFREQLPLERRRLYPSNFTEGARAQVAMMGLSEKERQAINESSSVAELAQRAAGKGPGAEAAKAALKMLEDREIRIEAAKDASKAAADLSKLNMGMAGGSKLMNQDLLNSLNPAMQKEVRDVLEYKRDLTPYMITRSPYWKNIADVAGQVDPNWDPSMYGQRYKMRLDFTSGKASGVSRALNTVAQHLSRLNDSVDALGNAQGDTVATKGINWTKNAFVDKKAQNQMNIDRDAVANELENAYRAGGGSESGVKSWKENFSVDNAYDIQKNGIKEVGNLVEGLINSLYAQYEKGMGRTADFDLIDPKSKDMFEKLGIKLDVPTHAKVAAPATEGQKPKKITPEAMELARKANPGMPDADIIKGLESHGYSK